MEPLILKGNAYQRGISHGKRFATEIRECLNAFKHESSDQTIMSAVDKTIELLGGTFPEINEEIRGISDGAEVPFRDTFLFNNRAVVNMVDTETCSDLAIQAGGTVVVGMNKDRSCPMAPYEKYFLKKVYPEEGYALITYGHVGRVWGHGMNEQGLCTAGTAAYPLHNDAVVPSFGSYLVPPLLLSKCKDVPEALDLLEQFRPICDSGNFLLCDAAGEMAVVEITPAQRVVRKPDDDHLIASTFFASGEIEHRDNLKHLLESQNRYATIQDYLAKEFDRESDMTLDGMKRILRLHRGDGPVCRHEETGVTTVLSWVAFPETREFYFCVGLPCEGEYELYTLNS